MDTPTALKALKDTFAAKIAWKDYSPIDIVLGAVIANTLDGDSVCLYVIGPPSTGKTEFLRSLEGYAKVRFLSSLTPKTFISGYNEQGKRGRKNEKSFLLRLEETEKVVLVVKEFNTLLQMRNDERKEIVAQIREIADGTFCKEYGTGESVLWRGKLGFIVGVTPTIDREFAVNQQLGERFLSVRYSLCDAEEMARRARKQAGSEAEFRKVMADHVKAFFKTLEGKDPSVKVGEEIGLKVEKLSCFVAQGRTSLVKDKEGDLICLPVAEGPPRLTKQLITLAQGIAIVQGKSEVDEAILDLLRRVARDTLPAFRNAILETLWRKGEAMSVSVLERVSGYPYSTLERWLKDLKLIQLVTSEMSGDERFYFLSEEAQKLVVSSGIY
jgi:DNA-binding transcriptional ArsR family regulator